MLKPLNLLILFNILLFGLSALAEVPGDAAFHEAISKYQAANPKPEFPEVAHKYKVQADFAAQENLPEKAIELYGNALSIVPWWAEGHYKLAILLGNKKEYRDAMREMKRFLFLAPNAPEARAAQDKIYQWETVAVPEAGKSFKDCPECPEMVEIPASSFAMGSKNGNADEQPVHNVTFRKGFAIGKTEVTQKQWEFLMRDNPSYFSNCGDDCPVEQVSWNDVQKFIQKLNEKTGKHYRLPTESEWEYACRAGRQQEYCGSDNVEFVAWNNNNSGRFLFNSTHPVAKKLPNDFGLYDMSGNVWEWVQDDYHENYLNSPTDGSAWAGDSMRVLRGGSWGKDNKESRAANRHKFSANYRDWSYGFRLARDIP